MTSSPPELPHFTFHPDPIQSGSITPSAAECRCCGEQRGFIYTGPVYSAEEDLDDVLCPWCIADGSAHAEFDATFVDDAALGDDVPESSVLEITERTPGFNSWQSEQWPSCCDDATQFIAPAGITELRQHYRTFEASVLNHIIYDMGISGGAALRKLESLHRDQGPTAYLFQCPRCGGHKVYVDQH
jgi:uncharacterized protein CbrC (UPF0167 family)